MAHPSVEEVYEQVVRQLPGPQQLRLVARIVDELARNAATPEEPRGADWMSLRGIAPDLLGGVDAQEWVSRSRREADQRREPGGQVSP